jgi:hypothetical protein
MMSALVRAARPAALVGAAVAALWTLLALGIPSVATGNPPAVAAIVAAGLVAVVWPTGRTRRQVRQHVLLAAATCALLIYLVVGAVLPAFPEFVSDSHPPTFTDVTRLVDPVGELGIFVVLLLALGLGAAIQAGRRRAARREAPVGPNEMVVLPVDTDRGLR